MIGQGKTAAEAIIRKACEYGRYGYRRIARMIELEGFHVNHKRVERIRRERGSSFKREETALAGIMAFRGTPEYIRSDNGPEFVAKKLRDWLASVTCL